MLTGRLPNAPLLETSKVLLSNSVKLSRQPDLESVHEFYRREIKALPGGIPKRKCSTPNRRRGKTKTWGKKRS